MRELENVLERAVTLCDEDVVTADDIVVKENGDTARTANTDLGDQLQDVERDAIIKALEECRYNKTASSEEAGYYAARAALSHRKTRHRLSLLT